MREMTPVAEHLPWMIRVYASGTQEVN